MPSMVWPSILKPSRWTFTLSALRFWPHFHGLSPNMDTLKIDLDKLDALALSHGHRDHFGGLVDLLKSRRERIPKGIPLYVGEDAFAPSGVGKGPEDGVCAVI